MSHPCCPAPERLPPQTRRSLRRSAAVWLSICLWLGSIGAAESQAVLLSTGDGSGNTTEPPSDPGFANVGVVNGLSGVYVRNGWVLTAGHVGRHPITLLGTTYTPVPGSGIRFENDDGSLADLFAFKLASRPPLPDLAIASGPPATNMLLTIVGNGRNRGAETNWMGVDGWAWGNGKALRWGTNRVSTTNQFSLNTDAFWTSFDDIPATGGNPHESDIVVGDSGGAAFTGSGASAELVGILFARAGFEGQPASTSLFGNAGVIADLFSYRDDILAVIDQSDCEDGLDNDGDGLADFGNDPGCESLTDSSEKSPSLACDNDIDDDDDGLADFPDDPGCSAAWDLDERSMLYQCDNGLDDDGDQVADYPDDDGCLHPSNPIEAPEPGTIPMLGAGIAALLMLHARRALCDRDVQSSSTRSTR